ncbi:DUF2507 domain-containing protein [Evansella clarkii]|uniref:DUF2507 domain-containing protein n=1 Tax=Evansella clarkii TaxID=79879 RepID=UPI000998B1C1|nr:DUF2507 domain-containing protein [Evansella clarkii]
MKKKSQMIREIEDVNETVPAFSNHILRHVLLPELLGKEEEMILYWAGKALYRKLASAQAVLEDKASFFSAAGWGDLELIKEKRTELHYELVAPRMEKGRPFTLETGFLSEWNENETGCITEATYEVVKKDPCTCRITVKWDPKDQVNLD